LIRTISLKCQTDSLADGIDLRGGSRSDIGPFDAHLPGRRLLQSDEGSQQSTLSRTGTANHDESLMLANVESEAMQNLAFAKMHTQIDR
jgi:hypothetical protein